MKSGEYSRFPLYKKEFDVLLDIHLKPLKSKYSRTIFKVLVEGREVGSLTTLDIQTNLDGFGIKVSKKEINGWLRSLLAAGLASKDEERGKPTTIDYDDKYTFDLWRLTDLGAKIAERLPNVLGTKPSLFEEDAAKTLEELEKAGRDRRTHTLRHIDELYLLVNMLKRLLEAEGGLKKAELRKRLKPTDNDMDRLLSNYSNRGRGSTLIIRKLQQHGLKTTLLRILGLSSDKYGLYALTDEGRRLAKALSPEGDVGH